MKLSFIKNFFKKNKTPEMGVPQKHKPVVLMIMDGFGVSADKIGSPWEAAEHPTFSEIEKNYPFTALQASGIAVGLPWGKEGNSEVGHLTIGAGRIIYNYLPKISTSIADGSFFKNEAFVKAVNHTKNPPADESGALHLLGLFSSGTVHSYAEHFYALLDLAKQNNVKTYLHLFSDGKDAPQKEGLQWYKNFEREVEQKYPDIKIASIVGRKYAMDRNANWDRTKKAYNLFVLGEGNAFQSASEYFENQYAKEIFDEAIEPGFLENSDSRIKDNDSVIFFNFREDSERQLSSVFLQENFDKFERKKLNNLLVVTMTEYNKALPAVIAYNSANIEQPLGEIISNAGMNQFHIAESEKYAHITYFLNGGEETPFEKEDRVLVPSPITSSYSQTPEMSAEKITAEILSNINKYNFMAINFSNADMVGHTGDFEATIKALETLDRCVGKILPKILELNGTVIITSDHGNAEEKIYKITGIKKTNHSINPVPFYLIANNFKREVPATTEEINKSYKSVKGTLADVAPTVLELSKIKKPVSMTGTSLISRLIEQ